MAAYGWRTATPVATWLFAEPYRFNFYQAVRLLERMRPHAPSVGTTSNPKFEAVRFRGPVEFAFPASDIQALEPAPTPRDPARMQVNFLGLAGAFGPLPPPFAEQVAEQTRRRDPATAEFLDIFNHRLISFVYRIRRIHQPTLGAEAPWLSPFAGYLFALMGLGTDGLDNRLTVRDRCLLPFAGLFASQFRGAAGLRYVLRQFFAIPVEITQFQGDWQPLEPAMQTRLGQTGPGDPGTNTRLGDSVVLGRRFWDQAAGLEIRLGPMDINLFREFFPRGTAYAKLLGLVTFYGDRDLNLRLRLVLRRTDVHTTRLSHRGSPPLKWETRLLAHPPAGDDDQTVLSVSLRRHETAACPN